MAKMRDGSFESRQLGPDKMCSWSNTRSQPASLVLGSNNLPPQIRSSPKRGRSKLDQLIASTKLLYSPLQVEYFKFNYGTKNDENVS